MVERGVGVNGIPRKKALLEKMPHTKRIIEVLKVVLKEMDELKLKRLEDRGGEVINEEEVVIYTNNNTVPNITRCDLGRMIFELEERIPQRPVGIKFPVFINQ